jgi:hypothetical protein
MPPERGHNHHRASRAVVAPLPYDPYARALWVADNANDHDSHHAATITAERVRLRKVRPSKVTRR